MELMSHAIFFMNEESVLISKKSKRNNGNMCNNKIMQCKKVASNIPRLIVTIIIDNNFTYFP